MIDPEATRHGVTGAILISRSQEEFSYKILDRFGLPTFFAVALLVLLVWQDYIFNKAVEEFRESNIIKVQLLHEIIDNQHKIIENEDNLNQRLDEIMRPPVK